VVTSAAASAVSCPTVNSTTGQVTPGPTPGVDWSGCDLAHAGLASFDLTGDNFSRADLTDATFRLSTLIKVDLAGAKLVGTSFNSAIMTDANLAKATVTSDDFAYAGLTGANLTGVNLSAATLDNVTSGGIAASHAPSTVPAGWRFTVGYLVGSTASLFEADLAKGNLSDLNLAGLSMIDANLIGADIAGTNLVGSNLWKADLTGADLAGATVTNANFLQTVLTGANLSGVDFRATIFANVRSGGISAADAPAALPPKWKFIAGYLVGPSADLDGAVLTGADLSGLDLTDTTLFGATLTRAKLTGALMATTTLAAVRSGGVTGQPASLPANFAVKYGYILGPGVDLDGASLAGQDLSGLDLNQATLTAANLAGADLTGTNLAGSDLTAAELHGAAFGGTSLSQAILTEDNLSALDLVNSDLTLARLGRVDLSGASLSGDNLTGADLRRAILTGLRSGGIIGAPSYLPADWSTYYGYLLGPRADLAGASMHGDYLYDLDLAGATLTNADLRRADIRGADLTGARLDHVDFAGADLSGVELTATDAYLNGVNWTGATCPDGQQAGVPGCFPPNRGPRPGPRISLSVRVGVPTGAIQVTGTGFRAGEQVAIYFESALKAVGLTAKTGRLGPVTITVPRFARLGLRKVTARAKVHGQAASAWFTVETDWVQSQFGPTLDGYNAYENTLSRSTVGNLRVKWKLKPGASEANPPTIAGGLAYIPTFNGHMYAVNAATGRKLWTWTAPAPLVELTSLAVSGNTVYVNAGGTLYAIGPGGKQEWQYLQSAAWTPTIADGVVYISGGDVSAVKASSGRQLWSVDPTATSGCDGGQPAVTDGVAYVTCGDGNLYALNAATGATLWSYSNGGNDLMSPAVAGGVVYVGDALGHVVHAISTTSHQQVWSYTTGDRIGTVPAVANGTVYVSSFDGNLYALNATTGAKEWAFNYGTIPVPFGMSPAVANGVVYVTSPNEIVYALNANTGAKLWSYSNGNVLQSGPVVADGTVYVGTGSGGAYAFAPGQPASQTRSRT
jgi:uncharacterized protein YjbI with pentapeptide repeats/outer membrane protein assembly factor BamB